MMSKLLPTSWGNEVIYKKHLQMQDFGQDINTVFIGTSRVHCHIDPIQFDKETKQQTLSWNMASPGAAGLETYRIINELIQSTDEHSIRTIYLEMPSYNSPPVENADNVRATYFLDIKQWWKSVSFMSGRHKGLRYSIVEGLRSTKLLLSNLLGLNQFKTKLTLLGNQLLTHKEQSQSKKRGFSGLNRTAKEYGPIKSRLQFARKFYSEKVDIKEDEIDYLTNDIKTLISEAEANGVTLVYVLMPKIPISKYIDNYQSFVQLKKKNRLNLSNPKEYPKFYEQKYSSDKAHLNTEGAKLMTSELSKHYNQYHSR